MTGHGRRTFKASSSSRTSLGLNLRLSLMKKKAYEKAKMAPQIPKAKTASKPSCFLRMPLTLIPVKKPIGKRPSKKASL